MQKKNIIFLLIFLAAAAIRLPNLEQRPMHGDEAVHAIKFGALLEDDSYRYDPAEYHGPTLNYFSLIPAWLTSATKLTEITESTLRVVPVVFGLLLILFLLLLVRGLSWPVVLVTALFSACSLAMTFYSRYYIQEMLLTCFIFGAICSGYRYSQHKNFLWAGLTGIFLGLMHATKETFIIAFAAMTAALLITVMARSQGSESLSNAIEFKHALAAIAAAIAISVLFFSSFFSNWQGVVDSVLTYNLNLERAVENELHIHPWYYYFKILLYSKIGKGPVWSEALIVILAVAGFVFAFTKEESAGVDKKLLRFLAIYTLLMTIAYSLIPYKTPWNLLGFFHGMILLAAVATIEIRNALRHVWMKRGFVVIVSIGIVHLAWQNYFGNYKYDSDPSNPYVYAHPTRDIFTMLDRIDAIAQSQPEGRNVYMQFICKDDDYWPFPWYLRRYPNLGWWNKVDTQTPAAPIIIVSPSLEAELTKRLYVLPPPGQRELYVPLFESYLELRPQVELRGYLSKTLWDRFQHDK